MLPNPFGVFQVEELLGKGGMGEVWRATDTRLERRVALKVLLEDQAHDPNRRKRFLREARAVSSLAHPNIVTIYDIGTCAGIDYIAMELVSGTPLSAIIATGPLAPPRALEIARAIASGLSCAHKAGIIHRDLKPGNIMVSDDGIVKVLDFGLATIQPNASTADETRTQLTTAGAAIGTLGYMPPEQVLGEPATPASDVFSFGVLFYEMLTGRMPFDGATRSQQVRSMLQRKPIEIQRLQRDISPRLAAIVMRCLAHEPENRYANAVDLLSDLDSLVAPAPSRPRKSWGLGIAAAATLLICAAFAIPAFRPGFIARPLASADKLLAARESLLRYDLPSRIDNAEIEANSVLATQPNSAAAYQILAQARFFKHYANRDALLLKQSIQFALKAIELDPYLAAAHIIHGAALTTSGDLRAAESSLRRGAELDPRNPLGALFEAQWLAASRRLADAEAAFAKAQGLAPSIWFVWSQSGSFHYRNGEFEKAAREFEKASQLAPNNTRILANLSTALHMLDRNDEAAAAIQRALEIEPSDILYTNLGTLRFYEGRYLDALPAMQKAVELGAMDYANWANLGDVLRWIPARRAESKDAYATAIRLLEERLKTTPTDLNLNTLLISLLAKDGRTAQVTARLNQLPPNLPNQPSALYRLAITREILGQRDLAIQLLTQAMQAGYSVRELNNDPELAALRKDQRYQRALTQLSASR